MTKDSYHLLAETVVGTVFWIGGGSHGPLAPAVRTVANEAVNKLLEPQRKRLEDELAEYLERISPADSARTQAIGEAVRLARHQRTVLWELLDEAHRAGPQQDTLAVAAGYARRILERTRSAGEEPGGRSSALRVLMTAIFQFWIERPFEHPYWQRSLWELIKKLSGKVWELERGREGSVLAQSRAFDVYAEWLGKFCDQMHPDLTPGSGYIETLYTPLDAFSPPQLARREHDERSRPRDCGDGDAREWVVPATRGEFEREPVAALFPPDAAAGCGPHVVLLGDPGSGKSTFVRHLAWTLLAKGRPPLVMSVPVLARYWRTIAEAKDIGFGTAVRTYFDNELAASEEGLGAALQQAFARDRAGIVMLDAVDEVVTDDDQRRAILSAVSAWLKGDLRETDVLITARPHAYADTTAWPLVEPPAFVLAPFDHEQQSHYVARFYSRPGIRRQFELSDAEAERREAEMQRFVEGQDEPRRASIRDVLRRPMLLTLVCGVHLESGRPPHNRVALYERSLELYQRSLDLMLERWPELKAAEDETQYVYLKALRKVEGVVDRLRVVLEDVAFDAQERQSGRAADPRLSPPIDIRRGLVRAINDILGEAGIGSDSPKLQREVSAYIERYSGVLVGTSPKRVDFDHRSFQEYLAARHLLRLDREDGRGFCEWRDEQLRTGAVAWWREVLSLALEQIAWESGVKQALAWALDSLLPETLDADKAHAELAWIAWAGVAGAADNGEQPPARLAELKVRCERALRRVVDAGWLPAIDRAAIGRLVGEWGDHRHGTGVTADGLPDIAWVAVPGTAEMGLDGGTKLGTGMGDTGMGDFGPDPDRDENWHDGATLIPIAPFTIAAFPVTVAQFDTFRSAEDGYRDRRWWASFDGWHEPGRAKARSEPRLDVPNHPVVDVDWYEAVAFCRWLSARTGRRVRLPTEAEWEWAARGPQGNPWPWGAEDDPAKRNSGSFVDGTTAIGLYPSGVACWLAIRDPEARVYDLSGNVDEWTCTPGQEQYDAGYESGHPIAEDWTQSFGGGDDRPAVVRGGGWSDDGWYSRAACRDFWHRDGPSFNQGFRLVRSAPAPAAE